MIIHDLEEEVMQRLRAEAALHGNSLEEEAVAILRKALSAQPRDAGPAQQENDDNE